MAVLHAVDDLLMEEGYAAMTMKGIAERAGVSRQTIYRWWATKAEILFEASVIDARHELAVEPGSEVLDGLVAYLDALVRFLTASPAGAGYRALLGEAQHDTRVAQLMATNDVLAERAQVVVKPALRATGSSMPADVATVSLIGPVFYWILSGRPPALLDTRERAGAFLRELGAPESA